MYTYMYRTVYPNRLFGCHCFATVEQNVQERESKIIVSLLCLIQHVLLVLRVMTAFACKPIIYYYISCRSRPTRRIKEMKQLELNWVLLKPIYKFIISRPSNNNYYNYIAGRV